MNIKIKINWNKELEELLKLLDRRTSKMEIGDVIVSSSGGKNSGYIYRNKICLRYESINSNMVTFKIYRYWKENLNSKIDKGFTICVYNFQRKLARLCFEQLGDAFSLYLFWVKLIIHFNAQIRIKLVFMVTET